MPPVNSSSTLVATGYGAGDSPTLRALKYTFPHLILELSAPRQSLSNSRANPHFSPGGGGHRLGKCLSLASCSAFWGNLQGTDCAGLAWDRTPGMIAAAAYAARGMEPPFSMGLRPRLSADAAFAAFWNPGLAPGGLSFKNPVPRQRCDFGESGVAAVEVGHPRKRLLLVFLIEQRSCGFV